MRQGLARGVFAPLCVWLSAVCAAQTGSAPYPVNGTLGGSVSLTLGITAASRNDEVVWKRNAPQARIARYENGNTNYYGPEEYQRRVELDLENFSLEIRELQRDDAGEYEMVVTTKSGVQKSENVGLEVYEPVSGTSIQITSAAGNCNITLRCSLTSGDRPSFRWWRGAQPVANDSHRHLLQQAELLQLYFADLPDDQPYRCVASNPVSEGRAEVRLHQACNVTVPDSGGHSAASSGVVTGVCVGIGACAGIIGIGIHLRRTRKTKILSGKAKDRTEDSSPGSLPATIYAEVKPTKRVPAERMPPEGIDTVESCGLIPEVTVYDTIKSPGSPCPRVGPAVRHERISPPTDAT